MSAWSIGPAGATVTLRVTPRSSRDGIDGLETRADGVTTLKARVRAAPEDGKANMAVARLLADALDVSAGSVSLASGAKGRVKQFRVEGDPSALAARLAARSG